MKEVAMPQSHRTVARLTDRVIDLSALWNEAADPGAGAVLSFVGTVRDNKLGRRVLGIEYEAYAPMATRVLQQIADTMLERWPLAKVLLVHRYGDLEVGAASVAILVAAAHRAEGFEALRYGIEAIKRDVPIWKKERFEDGSVWVQEGS
jgi:molybdopterin synthase catalytic subunit